MNQRPENQDTEESKHELDWIAFCYIAGELSDAEAADFENQLEDDVATQQAVVRAMDQARVMDVAFSTPATAPASIAPAVDHIGSTSTPIPRFLFVAAASLMLIVMGWGWYANNPAPESTVDVAAESEQLADAWEYTDVAISEAVWVDEFDDSEEDESASASDEESDDWMYVALTDLESSLEAAE